MGKSVYFLTAFLLALTFQIQHGKNKSLPIFEDREAVSAPFLSEEVPDNITRTIIQDRKGDIWFATFTGVFRYDGTTFTNVTKGITKARFFSAMEDRNGNLWFGSIGEGVYRYNGSSFQHINTEDGLINDEISSTYEDARGRLWFGANGGISCYEEGRFTSYVLSERSVSEAETGLVLPSKRPPLEVNAIVEDGQGNLWFATRGCTFRFDGTNFRALTHDYQYFQNVRWMIRDRHDNVWLAGNDGLWIHDGNAPRKISGGFTTYICEDQGGNIWTASHSATTGTVLARYDHMLPGTWAEKPTVIPQDQEALFGIMEDANRNIWLGTLNGILRYDGEEFRDFKE